LDDWEDLLVFTIALEPIVVEILGRFEFFNRVCYGLN
jgi:hypothetical protein